MNMGVPDISPELITANTFWVDYAKWTGEANPTKCLKHIGACGSPMPITQGTVVITNQCASILTQPISTPSCTDVIILTNTSSSRQRVELFVQVPAGAIPIKGQYTVTQLVDLSPFSIWQSEYLFYFPETGSYPHLSAYVSKSGELLARSSPTTIVVTNKYNPIDRTSWATIVSRGSTRDVLDQEPK
ncbi:hypothetical protein BC938DRAFT_480792 [Jimgerdemannia flammicorona]|uniref:Uncharacterized protein n=1 Tax=Jimgerdemannia flammicorona TaxID=994334 RepID=A0A433QHP0_9FUNG|nr:hypothetical protein BC938DRAFT_480792 [Jimgerdemannia flammicorona]